MRGSLTATTSGGGVDIDGVGGELFASTSGGGVEIRGAGARVEAHSSGGPVTVRFAAGNNRGGVLSTSGGGVRTEIDPRVALTIDASSSGGNVESDVPVTIQGRIDKDSLRGELNGGGVDRSPFLLFPRPAGRTIAIVASDIREMASGLESLTTKNRKDRIGRKMSLKRPGRGCGRWKA